MLLFFLIHLFIRELVELIMLIDIQGKVEEISPAEVEIIFHILTFSSYCGMNSWLHQDL